MTLHHHLCHSFHTAEYHRNQVFNVMCRIHIRQDSTNTFSCYGWFWRRYTCPVPCHLIALWGITIYIFCLSLHLDEYTILYWKCMHKIRNVTRVYVSVCQMVGFSILFFPWKIVKYVTVLRAVISFPVSVNCSRHTKTSLCINRVLRMLW